ncbi:hypothetical protein QOZ80_7AG0564260 [Eleusine coracana subsp. coracana]|nr:hypothetical protein QOZ80_7AG0564260 [Eleusine coracana subsp. coracana]
MALTIRDVLLDDTWNSDELLNAMANAMYIKFEKYWAKPNIVLLVVAVLDPCMKMDFLKFYFYTIAENVEEKMRDLRTSLNKFYVEVSLESAFSAAGRILGKDRTSLAPGTLEALICTKDWFIGFSPDDEGQPIEGKRIFDPEDDEEYD